MTTDAFDPESFLPYRLMRVADGLEAHFLAFSAGTFDLSWPEWQVLNMLARMPVAAAKDIAARSHIHKAQVSRAVAALENRGWLTRARDGSDKRLERLELTDLGRRQYAGLAVLSHRYELALVRLIGGEALARLQDTLAALEDGVAAGALEQGLGTEEDG